MLEAINAWATPQMIIDALFTGASELMLRHPRGSRRLPALTTTKAMHCLSQSCGHETTRWRLVLQGSPPYNSSTRK